MAYTGIMCTEAEIDQRSGANVSASYTDVMKTAAVLAAESKVNDLCQYNFSDNYATLNADVKYLLTDVVASIVAIQAICYDMSGYTSIREAENMVNVLGNAVTTGMSILMEQAKEDFINAA